MFQIVEIHKLLPFLKDKITQLIILNSIKDFLPIIQYRNRD
jgi:hypothetical protein